MNGLRDSFYRFMTGRYGLRALRDMPQLILFGCYFVLVVINLFVRADILRIFQLLILGYTLFRMLSKNIPARENENRIVSAWVFKLQNAFRFRKANAEVRKANAEARKAERIKQKERRKDKTHIYRECPACGATLRLPKKKGKHNVLCPRCNQKFGITC